MDILSPDKRIEFLNQPCHFCGYSKNQGIEPDVLKISDLGFFPACSFCKNLIISARLNYKKAIEAGKRVKIARDSWNGEQSEFINSKQAKAIKKSFFQQS